MKRRKLILLLSSALLLALAGILFFGFSYLGWGFGPQLTDIEVGMTLEEVEEMIPGVKKLTYSWLEKTIYFYGSQRALITLRQAYSTEITGVVVFNELRQPLKVALNGYSRFRQIPFERFNGDPILPDEISTTLASADLLDADFANLTLYDLTDQYGFGYSNSSSLGHAQNLILSDGHVMHLGGVTFSWSDAYRSFTEEFRVYSFTGEAENHSIGGNTYLDKVTVWDIFQLKPGMSWFDLEVTTLYEESFEEHDRKNSDYFLRWIQEHIPEGMTQEEVDRWIDTYRANSEK